MSDKSMSDKSMSDKPMSGQMNAMHINTLSIAFLGPPGTYAEMAASACAQWLLAQQPQQPITLHPYPTIAKALEAVASNERKIAVVPVENSIEGTVTITLDTLWQLDHLQIQQAFILPIEHALLSYAPDSQSIRRVYSHPQALAQCQRWLAHALPQAQLLPTSSTTEFLSKLLHEPTAGAIASQRAAQLYHVPILACPISDYPNNCTQFWVLSLDDSPGGSHTSIAFSLPANVPGALVKPLEIFARSTINLSRIQSRPAKQEMGFYLFFIDLEANILDAPTIEALTEVSTYTETLKIFGSYSTIRIGAHSALDKTVSIENATV